MNFESDELFDELRNKSNLNEGLERGIRRVTGPGTGFDFSSYDFESQVSDVVMAPVVDFIKSSTMFDVLNRMPESQQERSPSLQVAHDFPVAVAGFLAEELGARTIFITAPVGSRSVRTEDIQKTVIELQEALKQQIQYTFFKSSTEEVPALGGMVDRAWKGAIVTMSRLRDKWKCKKDGNIVFGPPDPTRCSVCGGKNFEKL